MSPRSALEVTLTLALSVGSKLHREPLEAIIDPFRSTAKPVDRSQIEQAEGTQLNVSPKYSGSFPHAVIPTVSPFRLR